MLLFFYFLNMNNNNFNIVIIGAGVIGLAIAERLSRQFSNILVIDKENKFGQHTSSRNSEVIHSGFYYKPNSLKAKLCTIGNKMIYDFCAKYNINFKKCGKLVVCNDKSEIEVLHKLKLNAEKNGIKNVELIYYNEARKIEPRVKCYAALWFKDTGVMDSHGIMSKLENLAKHRDVSFLYNYEVSDIKKESNGYKVSFLNDTTNINSNIIINAAGLWCDHISRYVGGKYKIDFYKGDYFKSSKIKDLNCLIYPLPTSLSLGIHAILNLNGGVVFGPNAYKVKKINYETNSEYKNIFKNEISKIIDFEIEDLTPDYSGIRPKILTDGIYNDFIINEDVNNKNFYNLIGIDSPGLTSSLAIADYIFNLIKK